MVDIKVFTDQYGKLDKKTEIKIRKLLRNTKNITVLQAAILQSIIDDSIKTVGKINTVEQAAVYSTINIFQTTKASEKLIPYQVNIGRAFEYGAKFESFNPSNTIMQLEELVKQSSQQFITKMGEDLKVRAGEIVADGISKGTSVNDVVANLEHELTISRSRANSIARTETMRAANSGSYSQAIRDNKQYYIVDSRAEACDLCQDEFDGEVFPISDAGNMPPLHPNCACIPVYFNDQDEAQGWSNNISKDNQDTRDSIEDSGKIIPKDGTGSNSNS